MLPLQFHFNYCCGSLNVCEPKWLVSLIGQKGTESLLTFTTKQQQQLEAFALNVCTSTGSVLW